MPHHKTLRAAMDCSYDLLTEQEPRVSPRAYLSNAWMPIRSAGGRHHGDRFYRDEQSAR
jgi:hypothetical protein